MSGDTSSRLKAEPAALRLFVWIAGSAAILWMWAWGAAYAPPSLRLLILWGIGAGVLLALLTRALKLPHARLMAVLAFVATGVGGIAYTWACSQQGLDAIRERIVQFDKRMQSDPANAIIRQFEEARDIAADPDALAKSGLSRAEYERQRREFLDEISRSRGVREARRRELEHQLTFDGYLHRRVASGGAWPNPWPALFWGAELLVAGLLAGAIVYRVANRPFCANCDDWERARSSATLGAAEAVPVLGLLGLNHPHLQPATRLILDVYGCRCDEAPHRLRCRLDEPGGRIVELGECRPAAQVWLAVQPLLHGSTPPAPVHSRT